MCCVMCSGLVQGESGAGDIYPSPGKQQQTQQDVRSTHCGQKVAKVDKRVKESRVKSLQALPHR